MIARNISFFLMIATEVVFAASNINCVVDAFDKERQDFGKELAAKLAQPEVDDGKAKAAGDKGPTYQGDSLFQFAKKKLKNFVGISDPSIDPVSYATLMNRYTQQNTEFISAEGRHWINQQCVPYVDDKYKVVSRSVYVCGKLYTSRRAEVEALESIKNVGFHAIGRVLKDVAGDTIPDIKLESSGSKFATTQSELKSAEGTIAKFYSDIVDNVLNKFDKKYSKFIANVEEKDRDCSLSNTIKAYLGGNHPAVKRIVNSISVIILSEKIKTNSGNCQLIRNVLGDHKDLFSESPTSDAYVHLGDRIIERINGKRTIQTLLSNVIFPFCLAAITESGDHTYIDEMSVCEDTIKYISDSNTKTNNLVFNALEAPQVVDLLKDSITQSVNEVRNDMSSDFKKFTQQLKKNWEFALNKRGMLVQMTQVALAATGLREELSVPLIVSLEELLATSGITASQVFTADFLKAFKDGAANTVYASNKVTDIVETHRTNTIKALGQLGKNAKEFQFKRRLSQKCRLIPQSARVEICLDVVKGNSFRSYLHYRYNDAIFDLIIDRINEKLSKVDLKLSNLANVKKTTTDAVRLLLDEFDEEVKRLGQYRTELLAAHGDVRCMSYILAAKTVYIDGTGLLPTQAYEYISNFANRHGADLIKFKLRHFEFGQLLKKLTSEIAQKTAEEKSAADRLKNQNAQEQDSNLKEFGLSGVEKGIIKRNLLGLFQHYDHFTDSLKKRLSICKFKDSDLDRSHQECQSKNNGECLQLNPFLLGQPCARGYDIDRSGYCVASCPDLFTTESIRFCRKPEISVVELRQDGPAKTYKCAPGYQQEGLLCVARCPVGWSDFGALCERPHSPFNYSSAVLMVE